MIAPDFRVFSRASFRSLLRLFASFLFAWFCAAPFTFADLSSTNYAVKEERISGGGGVSISSTNYAIPEGAVDFFDRLQETSTNYKVEGTTALGESSLKVPVIASVSPAALGRFYTDGSAV